jgi:hypothetical protein
VLDYCRRRRSGAEDRRLHTRSEYMPQPLPLSKMLGPSVILIGVGVASGEYILWPYITSQVGLVFLWATVVGVLTQYFINMEVERHTLSTGETAITGFTRLWKPWGVLFIFMAVIPNIWPAWATSSATACPAGDHALGGPVLRWLLDRPGRRSIRESHERRRLGELSEQSGPGRGGCVPVPPW